MKPVSHKLGVVKGFEATSVFKLSLNRGFLFFMSPWFSFLPESATYLLVLATKPNVKVIDAANEKL